MVDKFYSYELIIVFKRTVEVKNKMVSVVIILLHS